MKKVLMACVIVLCSVAMATAQGPQGPRGQGGGAGGRGQGGQPGGGMGFVGGFGGGGAGGIGAILRDADLRKGLGITEEQVTRFQEESQKFAQEMREAMPQFAGRGTGGAPGEGTPGAGRGAGGGMPQLSDADREAMQKVRREFATKSRKMMEDIFSTATVEKLDMALFQFAQAGRGLPTAEDFAALKLTDEQKKTFEEMAQAFQTAQRELPRPAATDGAPAAGGPGGFQTSEAYVALVKEYKGKQTAILTDAQKARATRLIEATPEAIKTLATRPMGGARQGAAGQPGTDGARQPGRQNLTTPPAGGAAGAGGGFRRASRTTEA